MAGEDDNKLYSQTIDRRRKGRGFTNILAHDPMRPGEEATNPAMQPYKYFKTEEEASEAAASEAQADYDRQRKDPKSQWYMGPFQNLGK